MGLDSASCGFNEALWIKSSQQAAILEASALASAGKTEDRAQKSKKSKRAA
jgi:hypothetical protein